MKRHINFTDGTYISIIGEGDASNYPPETIFSYDNAAYLIQDFGNQHPLFNSKTDLDGNVWEYEWDAANSRMKMKITWAGGGYSTYGITGITSTSQVYWAVISIRPDGETLRFTSLSRTNGGSANFSPQQFYDSTSQNNTDFATDIGQYPNPSRINALPNHGVLYYTGNRSGAGIPFSPGGNDVSLDKFAQSYQEIPDETDPYNPGGESGTDGGTGDFDGTGDDIDFPSLPTLSAVDTGFITLFNPTAGSLKSLANYMWSNPLFDLDAWKKIFADPMDAILGLSIVPVRVPDGGSTTVTVGNISTGVSMNKAAAQYVEVDCGTLNVNEFWGAYLDYDPFTKAEIYLPYIGTHPLAVDDIMGKSVHVKYHVDILSGSCCAYVKCGGSIIYSFVGQCSCSVPITGNDWTNVINGALSIAASIGTMVATGGASAPMAVSAIASTAVNSMKPNVEKSGSMGGMGGMLGVQTPYLILTRPRQALPRSQNKFIGYPSFITRKLSDVSGYTEIDSVHLDGIPATEQELSEIESLLKSGVIM